MADRIQYRRDTLENWERYNPVLLDGEVALIATDATKPQVYDSKKVGDGVHTFNDLEMMGYECLQELGNSTIHPVSQKVVSEKITELASLKRYGKDYTPILNVAEAQQGFKVYESVKLLAGNTYILTNNSVATISASLKTSLTGEDISERFGEITAYTYKEFKPSADGYLTVYANDINSFTLECTNEVYYKVEENIKGIERIKSDVDASKEDIEGNSRSIGSIENTLGRVSVFKKEQLENAHSVFSFVFEKGKYYTITNNGNGDIQPRLTTKLSTESDGVVQEIGKIGFVGENFKTFLCEHDAVGFNGWMQGTSINIEVAMNNSVKDAFNTLYTKVENNSNDISSINSIIGESGLKYEVLHKNVYISTSGVLTVQDNSIVTKPVAIHAGDTIKMKVPDSGLCIIAKPTDDGFIPIYNYEGTNTEQIYNVEEDIEVCFTVIEGSTINIIKTEGIKADIIKLQNKDLILDESMNIKVNAGVQRFIYECDLKKGDFVYIKFKEIKINTVAIALLDSSNNSVFSLGNLNIYQFPYKIYVPKDCKKIQFALWQSDWVDTEGDMQVVIRKYKSDNISIEDNLQSDGNTTANLTTVNCRMIKDGNHSINNYGQDGVKYEFDVPNKFSKLYLYFEWQAITALNNTSTPLVVAKLLDGIVRNYYTIGDMQQSMNGNIYRDTKYGHYQEGDNRVNEFVLPSGNERYAFSDAYFSFAGKDAIWVRFTGDTSRTATIKVTNTSIVCSVDDDSDVLEFSSDASLDSVVSAINNLSYFEAGTYLGSEHTFGELLKNDNLNINLIQDINDSGKSARIAPRRFLPFALDDEWHTCEILVNIPTREAFINHDGFTTFAQLDKSVVKVIEHDYSTICIGDSSQTTNSPIRFRNLDLKVDSDGEAEVVNYQWTAPDPTIGVWRKYLKQMISPRNPKIVLYECHDVIVGDDVDVPTSEIGFVTEAGMSATTGRLTKLFDYAKTHGYSFVTWEDIYNWKMFGKKLPKKCMNIMFDDFRISIYLDYDKRKPFVQYGVKPALAIITSKDRNLDEEVEFNGLRCTYREGLQMIRNAGWYMASHSYKHVDRLFDSFEKRIQDIKEDAIMADKYGVRMETYVTPLRNYEYVEYSIFKSSSIGCIVSGPVPDYICKGSNNFCLNRTELGLRVPYNDVIAPLK